VIWIDYFILAVIVISALLSLWRGFVAEALSLFSWIAALWLSILFFREFADFLAN